jgi:hypothetical protein
MGETSSPLIAGIRSKTRFKIALEDRVTLSFPTKMLYIKNFNGAIYIRWRFCLESKLNKLISSRLVGAWHSGKIFAIQAGSSAECRARTTAIFHII